MRLSGGIKVLIAAAFALAAAWMAVAQQPRLITDEVLASAGVNGEEWISYNVNWFEQRYSTLTQINANNVKRLGLAWSYDIPRAAGNPQNRQEATHLFHNGRLYSISPWSVVYAVDAKTGKEIWHQDPDVNQQIWQSRICCGVVNRGLALYEGNVIAPVVDGRMRAYDAATGRLVWETRVAPENMAYTITMAPRVIKGGKVVIGLSGGEYGVRGQFLAVDARTGELAWRFYTVPGDPSKPFEQPIYEEWAKTWDPAKEWWKIGGGGPVWNGFAYDPEADLVYVGTGQPGPWTDVHRGKGDALCTNCIIAVRGATGKYVWHYQTTPGDNWDYDSIADIMLADLNIGGRQRKVLMHAPKNGFFYVLDRRTGELLSAEPWVTVSWASGINLKTGRPIVNPEANYGTEGVQVMPGPGGGHVWPPWSFNPTTGLVYIPSTIGSGYNYAASETFTPAPTDIGPTGRGQMNMGTAFGGGRGAAGRGGAGGRGAGAPGGPGGQPVAPGLDTAAVAAAGDGRAGAGRGAPAGGAAAAPGGGRGGPQPSPIPTIGPAGRGNILSAWDPVTQTERWRAEGGAAGFNSGGTLATAGNLVFSSVNNRLLAFRADTGELLLDLETGLSQMGPPMTFMIDGKQIIAVAGGPPQQGGGRGGPGGGGAPGAGRGAPDPNTPPPAPSKLLALALDGAPIPAPQPAAAPAK